MTTLSAKLDMLRSRGSGSAVHPSFPAAIDKGGVDRSFLGGSVRRRHQHHRSPRSGRSPGEAAAAAMAAEPSLEPYVGKLERFELFSTNQCYYLVGCNKLNTAYRVLKMDRTLIERPVDSQAIVPHQHQHHQQRQGSRNGNRRGSSSGSGGSHRSHRDARGSAAAAAAADSQQAATVLADNSHTAKPTLRPLSEFLTEDPNVYSQEEIKDMLDMIHDGNRMTTSTSTSRNNEGGLEAGHKNHGGGGLKPIVKAYGIVGFIRFLDCYYLTLITRRAKLGSIGGNGIYTIKNTETIPLKPAERSNMPGSDDQADPSSVLLSMWNRGKRSVGLGLTNREIAELRYQGLYQVVDLTKNFHFSYTYDLTRSLQENFLAATTKPFPPPPFKDMYAWNYFLTRELEGCLHSLTSYHWIMPIVHGAFVQRKVNDYGRSLNLILVARRSRHFAGTRYLKRGVSEQGKVANDVEHEQIVHDESMSVSSGAFSSYLQVRGSIPTFWTQESSVTMPKPPIELNRVDPTYTATQLHFEDLLKRYSSPILVLDLVKQSEKREREVLVGNEYRHAIDYINDTIDEAHRIRYCALDYSHISKHRNLDVSSSLNEVSTWAVNQTGFFCSAPKWKIIRGGIVEPLSEEDFRGASRLTERLGVPVFPMEQNGVLRTNCIDCLDRTNVAQFSAGVEAIGQQLVVMGIRTKAKLDPSSNIVRVLIDMYVDIGDSVALQYGGSEAHKKVSTERSESNITGPIGKHKELLTSIRRYYSNAFTDRLKQDAMNLFLGYYLPFRHTVPLWEMETDYYLHNFHVKAGRGTSYSMKTYRRAFGIDWQDDYYEADPSSDKDSVISSPLAYSKHHARSGLSQQQRPSSTGPWNVSHETIASRATAASDESQRIARVRDRCQAQKDALSKWWKIALQGNIQQRMWMKLGQGNTESMLPPRYERLYQPDKIAQFDRFFARGWATPVRRSHSAQHSEGGDDDGESEFTRVISRRTHSAPDVGTSAEEKDGVAAKTLSDYVKEIGLEPRFDPSLKRFLEHHATESRSTGRDVEYVGGLGAAAERPREEYLRYVGPSRKSDGSPPSHRVEAIREFSACLHDYSLQSDDVDGIRKLADSAHISGTILSGPYRGLAQEESAIEVATTIHEQFNALESMGRGAGGQRLVESELHRRGYDTAGVKEAVSSGWKGFMTAERQYSEIVNGSSTTCRRSDLTTAGSLKLYASEYDQSTSLSTADLIFLQGEKPEGLSTPTPTPPPARTSTLVKKATRLGIRMASQSDIARAKSCPLFEIQRRRSVPAGFEQINEDMFARKDNKFMVLNGPGIDSWHGTQPTTKTSRVEDVLLSTLA